MSESIVRAALEAAGFPASDEDVAMIVAAHPAVRGMVDLLGPLLAASTEPPALRFEPAPAQGA